MYFTILGDIAKVSTIASGGAVRDRRRLNKAYGNGKWRKRKGFARVQLRGGAVHQAEIHWYEATGIGRREFKIKQIVD